jgi:hypothetical protein
MEKPEMKEKDIAMGYVVISRVLALLTDHSAPEENRAEGLPGDMHCLEDAQLVELFGSVMARGFIGILDVFRKAQNLANAGEFPVAGLVLDASLSANAMEQMEISGVLKALLSRKYAVVLLGAGGARIDLHELSECCTNYDFVHMYMSDIFSSAKPAERRASEARRSWVERAWAQSAQLA